MHVMITGASKGIGLAIAQRFAIEGNVSLSVCARNESTLWDARQAIEKEFPNVQVFAKKCDVSLEPDVKHFASAAIQTFGPVDLLVNNAGFGLFKNVAAISVDEFDRVLSTNLRGIFLMTQAVLPEMIERRSGTIVAISSLAGRNGFVGGAAYCASKFGVRGLMQSLFLEVRDFDIRAITVFPGSVDTDFFDTAGQHFGSRASNALRAEDVAAAVYAAVMLPSSATTSELDIRPTNPKKNISTM